MTRVKIAALLNATEPSKQVLIKGWVRTRRDAKSFSFLEVNDGSCLANIQVVVSDSLKNYNDLKTVTTGSAVEVRGELVPSMGKEQKWEIQVRELIEIGSALPSYPLQKKRHGDEFLRTIAHLRGRTNKYGAVFRIRSEMALAIHSFFHERGFVYVHTPVLTALDCEGAGEMFRVTTLPSEATDSGDDFFGKQANLTVSGQLEAEMLALALGDVYTFGPTFRAENSNTRRHASEFWMVEPEMAFCDLTRDMDLAEEFIHYLVRHALARCIQDLELFGRFVDKTLLPTLQTIAQTPFERIPYSQAIAVLTKSAHPFEYPVEFGLDLQSEHERYLTEHYFKKPVIVYDFPKKIKSFYMRLNDDGQTVASMDLLVPGIGEIIGGSQREERYDFLVRRMEELEMPKEPYWWYLESRQTGSVPHSGFGLGFERLIMLITGINNIRDVIPFPRTPKNIEF
jgi:asparaginyl-tRNA synthetase